MRIYRVLSDNPKHKAVNLNKATAIALRDMGIIRVVGGNTVRMGDTTVRCVNYRKA